MTEMFQNLNLEISLFLLKNFINSVNLQCKEE
jgi:hypothetical protein